MSLKKGTWENCLEHASITDVGMRRESNQDALTVNCAADIATWHQSGHVLMVADGMGAHAAGELASKLAVDGVSHLFYKYAHLSPSDAIAKSLKETNNEVHRRGQANLDFNNMGTTASVLVLAAQGAIIGHIGDSRVYRLRGSSFEQWTCDHSLLWEMRRAGNWTKEQERTHNIPKNVITKSIGPYPDVTPDVEGPLPLRVGDTFLLCTDGLTGRMSDEELGAIVAHFPPALAAQLLVDLTNMRGGPDNITVIIGRVACDLMATQTQESPPPAVAAQRPTSRRGLPIAWVTACVLALACLIFLIVDQHLVAAIIAALSLLAAIWGFTGKADVGRPRGAQASSTLGQGPYATVAVVSERETEQMLRGILAQIRETARVTGWEEDIDSLNEMEQSAESALRRNAIRAALDMRCQEARELAERLRIFHARRASSSTTDM